MLAKVLPSLKHLDRMTDSTGLIQHGIYNLPRRESGYTTDDNARALRLCVRMWAKHPDDAMLARVACYLSFLEHARCPVRGFHNFMGYQRDWLDAAGTGDCQGQAILALAEVLGSQLPEGFRALARELLESALPAMGNLRSLRAQAYLIQASTILWRCEVQEPGSMERYARFAADRLVACYRRSQREDWFWFEAQLTYANGVLPHALFDAAARWPGEEYHSIAVRTFGFLNLVTTEEDFFWPIGNNGWYPHGEQKAAYAQQPVEASTMAAAALAAYQLNTQRRYANTFDQCYRWFLGDNSLKLPLANREDGSCCDGLEATGVNLNQGAESTLAYLWTEVLKLNVAAFRLDSDLCPSDSTEFASSRGLEVL